MGMGSAIYQNITGGAGLTAPFSLNVISTLPAAKAAFQRPAPASDSESGFATKGRFVPEADVAEFTCYELTKKKILFFPD